MAWKGMVWCGKPRSGSVGFGELGFSPVWLGLARHGLARLGGASMGLLRFGWLRPAWAWRGKVSFLLTGRCNVTVKAKVSNNGRATEIGEAGNGGAEAIEAGIPYVATVRIRGVSDILFHRWDCDAVKSKGDAAKGSKAKKTDNLESYVYRNDEGEICIPGEYLRGSIVNAAKFRQDPRSPRKSAMDLFKAAVVALTPLASLGKREWDYEDRRRAPVQRQGITRTRPAFKAGWEAEFQLLINLPEYVSPEVLNDTITQAGKLIGIADFRPTFGRYQIVSFTTGLE